MSGNRSVTYHGARDLRGESVDYAKLEHDGRRLGHAMILKVVLTNICGSDQNIYRSRFSVPPGHLLGHEITGEVVEMGSDVENLAAGDLVSVPFNVACGRCRNCREARSDICETDLVNPDAIEAVLWDRMPDLTRALKAEVVSLGAAPASHACFQSGSPSKFVIDRQSMIAA